MNERASYAHGSRAARVKARSVRVAGPLLLALALAACAHTPPEACRTEFRSYPKPVFIGVPDRYTRPLEVPELPADLDNRDLETDIQALETVIDQAQSDRAELRKIDQRRRSEP